MFDDSRFMTIDVYLDGNGKSKWAALDIVSPEKGTRAATVGLGVDAQRLKRAGIASVVAFALAWFFYPNHWLVGGDLLLCGFWVWGMYRTCKVSYRVLLNPKDNLWYVIGNANLEQKIGTWMPCSDGFASQVEAALAAKRSREEWDR